MPIALKGVPGPQADMPCSRAVLVMSINSFPGLSWWDVNWGRVGKGIGTYYLAYGEGLGCVSVIAVEVDCDVNVDDVATL